MASWIKNGVCHWLFGGTASMALEIARFSELLQRAFHTWPHNVIWGSYMQTPCLFFFFLPFKRRVSRLNCFHFSCTLTAWKDFVVNYCPMWVAYGFLVACLKEMSSKSKIIPPWHACAWFILSCYSEVLLTLMAAPASWSHFQTLEFSWRLSAVFFWVRVCRNITLCLSLSLSFCDVLKSAMLDAVKFPACTAVKH